MNPELAEWMWMDRIMEKGKEIAKLRKNLCIGKLGALLINDKSCRGYEQNLLSLL